LLWALKLLADKAKGAEVAFVFRDRWG